METALAALLLRSAPFAQAMTMTSFAIACVGHSDAGGVLPSVLFQPGCYAFLTRPLRRIRLAHAVRSTQNSSTTHKKAVWCCDLLNDQCIDCRLDK